jgi:hypothetical protein
MADQVRRREKARLVFRRELSYTDDDEGVIAVWPAQWECRFGPFVTSGQTPVEACEAMKRGLAQPFGLFAHLDYDGRRFIADHVLPLTPPAERFTLETRATLGMFGP